MVPDKLVVTVGRGGAGGAPGTAGGYPNLATGIFYQEVGQTSANIGTVYYALPALTMGGTNSGRGGTTIAAGNGGTAPGLNPTSNHPGIMGFCNYAQSPTALIGQNGGLAAGGNNAPFVGRPQGGAGGGGVSSSITFNGGNVFAPTTSVNTIWSRNLLGGASAGAN